MNRLLPALLVALLAAACSTQPPAPTVDHPPSAQSKAVVPSGPGYYTVKKGDTLYRIALEHGQDQRDIAGWNNLTNPGSIREGQVLRVAPPGNETAGGDVVSRPIGGGAVVESRPLDKTEAPAVAPAPAVVSSDGVKREPKVNKEPYSDEAYARLGRAGETVSRPPETKPDLKPKPESTPAPAPAAVSAEEVSWIWPSSGKVLAPFSENGNRGLDIGGKTGDPVLSASEGKVVYAGSGLRGYGQLVIIKHNGTFLSAYAHNQKILVKEGQQVTKGQKIAEMGNTDSEVVKLHFEIRRQGKPIDPLGYLPKR